MLFDAFKIRDIVFKNRIAVSPMCQYSSVDGFANDWHLVHLGSRAVGGAALVMTEAAAVEARGRISPQDLGLWKDEHVPFLKKITDFIKGQNAVPGIQLAHAGRKASVTRPWDGDSPLGEAGGGWQAAAPSAVRFGAGSQVPYALTLEEISAIPGLFAAAAGRALAAGFQVVELHAAHGYLLHEFLSPVANKRADAYGGEFKNRARLALETARAVRKVWPAGFPLFMRISATDWLGDGAWDIAQSVELARALKNEGVDLVDCSSGAIAPDVAIPAGPGFQVPFAERIRREAGIPTGAVGFIVSPEQAETIVRTGQADLVLLGREYLRDPYWALHAAPRLHVKVPPPPQYLRAL